MQCNVRLKTMQKERVKEFEYLGYVDYILKKIALVMFGVRNVDFIDLTLFQYLLRHATSLSCPCLYIDVSFCTEMYGIRIERYNVQLVCICNQFSGTNGLTVLSVADEVITAVPLWQSSVATAGYRQQRRS